MLRGCPTGEAQLSLLSGIVKAELFPRTPIVAALRPECALKHQGCCCFDAQPSDTSWERSLVIGCILPFMPA